MAFLYITEYARQAKDNRGQVIAAGEEPSLVVQKIANDGGSVQSAALNVKTRFVRLHADSICSYKVGVNPTATTGDSRMAAGQTEYFGVIEEDVKKGDLEIAVILNT